LPSASRKQTSSPGRRNSWRLTFDFLPTLTSQQPPTTNPARYFCPRDPNTEPAVEMPSLKVPDAGLHLEGPNSNSASSLPAQAFAITLSDSVIEDMIKCVQSGEDIQLSLGSSPVSCYRIVVFFVGLLCFPQACIELLATNNSHYEGTQYYCRGTRLDCYSLKYFQLQPT
jgi:hypothetical protein